MSKRSRLLSLCFLVFGLSSCTIKDSVLSESSQIHECTYKWVCNDSYHWKFCEECGNKKDYSEHVWEEEIAKEATMDEEGVLLKTCICGQTKTETLRKLTRFEAAETLREPVLSDYGDINDDMDLRDNKASLKSDLKLAYQTSETFDAKKDKEYGFKFEKAENENAEEGYFIGLVEYDTPTGQYEYADYEWVSKIELYNEENLTSPVESVDFEYRLYIIRNLTFIHAA